MTPEDQSLIEQKISLPTGRDILPIERSFLLSARQLAISHSLKKLPEWVQNAQFAPRQKKQAFVQSRPLNPDNRQLSYKSLNEKYQRRGQNNKANINAHQSDNQYQIVYQRKVQNNYGLKFTYEYVSNDYKELREDNQNDVVFSESQNLYNSKKFHLKDLEIWTQKPNTPKETQIQGLNHHNQHVSEELLKLTETPQVMKPTMDRECLSTVEFDSHFECGNLAKAYRKQKIQYENKEQQYHLLMQNDTNTMGYNQWYFFRINSLLALSSRRRDIYNKRRQRKILIRIVNFNKCHKLYQKNMRPWILASEDGCWQTLSQLATFQKTDVYNSISMDAYYELVFKLPIDSRTIYVAMLPPYTYSKMSKFLTPIIQENLIHVQYAYSVLSNCVPILIINNFQNTNLQQQAKDYPRNCLAKAVQNVVIMARHHPGEIWSSYLMEQIIKEILKDVQGKKSRTEERPDLPERNIRYIIVPMLNPDGVIYGNFRTDFTGVDQNRSWLSNDKYLHPSIHSLKKLLSRLLKGNPKNSICLDIHSHSKSYGIFNYIFHEDSNDSFNSSRLLCDLLSSRSRSLFITEKCTFASKGDIVQSDKKSTARAWMANLCDISMTMEISFDGYADGKYLKKFTCQDFVLFSKTIVESLDLGELQYTSSMPSGLRKGKPRVWQGLKLTQKDQLIEQSDSQPELFYVNKEIKTKRFSKIQITKSIIPFVQKRTKSYSQKHLIEPYVPKITKEGQLLKIHQNSLKINHTRIRKIVSISNRKACENSHSKSITEREEKFQEQHQNEQLKRLRQSINELTKQSPYVCVLNLNNIKSLKRRKKLISQSSFQSQVQKKARPKMLDKLSKIVNYSDVHIYHPQSRLPSQKNTQSPSKILQRIQGDKIISLLQKQKAMYSQCILKNTDCQLTSKRRLATQLSSNQKRKEAVRSTSMRCYQSDCKILTQSEKLRGMESEVLLSKRHLVYRSTKM